MLIDMGVGKEWERVSSKYPSQLNQMSINNTKALKIYSWVITNNQSIHIFKITKPQLDMSWIGYKYPYKYSSFVVNS